MSIETAQRICYEGTFNTGEKFVFLMSRYNPIHLIKYFKKQGKIYNPNADYLHIDTNIYADNGSCWRFPQDERRQLWIELLRWKDEGGRYSVQSLTEWTEDNIQAFLNATGATVEKIEVLA